MRTLQLTPPLAPCAAPTSSAGARAGLTTHLPYLILLSGVFFNAVLAIVNAHVTSLTPTVVIVVEVLLISAALLIALARYAPAMAVPIAFIVWLFLFMLLRSAVVEIGTSVKFFRDMLIAPVFLMLGLCTERRYLHHYVLTMHGIIVAVAALEAFNTPAYSALFHVKDYFIGTRGLTEENFWNTESDLFVSATRTGSRFIAFADRFMAAHRVSSVFLEPVSLGAYCVIIAGYTFACWRSLSWRSRIGLLVSNFFLIVACDGRLAVASFVILTAVCLFWRGLPRAVPILYLPSILLLSFIYVIVTHQTSGNDDFPGRIAWTVELLRDFDVRDLLGFSDVFLDRSVDSGVGYILLSQSIFGLILFWLMTSAYTGYRTREQICYTHAIALHVALNALVSYGFLSIKTASAMWLIRGVLESKADCRLDK